MITLALVIAAAAIALGLGMRTRVPESVLAVLAGVGLQAAQAPLDAAIVREGLLMSATFLVFIAGAAIERKPLEPHRPAAIGLAATTLFITAVVGALLFAVLDLDAWSAVYWVLALGGSSTLLVLELLRSRERVFEPIGRLVSATALVQDLAVISMLAGLALLSDATPQRLGVLGGLLGIALSGWVLARYVAPFVTLRLGLDEEERLLFVLLVLFAFAAIARFTGGVVVTGAYFAGMAISRFPVGDLARGYLKSFTDFFSTTFYVMLGLVITLPTLGEAVAEIVFVAALLLVRPFLLLPLARRAGLTVRSSIEAVTLLAPAGALGVIVALAGIELGHVGPSMLGMVAVVVVITSAVAPSLSSDRTTLWLTHHYPSSAEATLPEEPSGHVLLLGCGETGQSVLAGLRGTAREVVVVDDDPDVVLTVRERGLAALRGDGADPAVLRAAGADRAAIIVSTLRRAADNERLLSLVRGPTILVRVFSAHEASEVRRLGGQPIVESELAANALASFCERV